MALKLTGVAELYQPFHPAPSDKGAPVPLAGKNEVMATTVSLSLRTSQGHCVLSNTQPKRALRLKV